MQTVKSCLKKHRTSASAKNRPETKSEYQASSRKQGENAKTESNTNDRGFDVNYLNPIILFRAIEFETGQGAGNAILGLSSKYKWNDNINIYGQFILDEFSLNDIKGGEKSWKNKYGYQLGIKYFNAFSYDG